MLGISRSGVCSVHVRSMYSVLAMKYIHFSFKIYSWVYTVQLFVPLLQFFLELVYDKHVYS